MSSIQHQVVYLGMRMFPCGATRVIASHLKLLREAGHDVQLICHGLFAEEAFGPADVTPVRTFRGLEISARTVVYTSFLLEPVTRHSHIRCQKQLQFVQGLEVDYSASNQVQTKTWVEQAIAGSTVDGFFSPSAGFARAFRDRYQVDPVDVVWPCLDQDTFYPGTGDSRPFNRILVIGNRNYEIKGLQYAFEACEQLDRNRHKLIRIASRPPDTGERYDEFHLNPSLGEIGEIYRSCDLLVYPSLSEGFGLPVLEAMSCGLPVITTRCVGMAGWVSNGANAIVVNKACHRSIAEAILDLDSRPDFKRVLIENGLKTASRFTRARTLNALVRVLE